MFSIISRRFVGAAAMAALLAGCAGQTGALPVGSAAQASGAIDPHVRRAMMPYAAVIPDLVPPTCKKQKTGKTYASVTEKFTTKGGSICIPAFGGFGGTITYPSANPAVKVKLTSSTTNVDNLPQFGSGTPIFYLELSLLGSTTFGSNLPAGGGLAGKKIVPKKTYTAFGAVALGSLWIGVPPCYTVAKKSKYGGQIAGIGTVLKGQYVAQTNGAVVIYPGKQASSKCG